MPVLADNKKAKFDYEIMENYEAGLVLSGQEVKSARDGQMSLKGAFVTFHNGQAFILGSHISKYKPAGPLPEYDPDRSRRLLLRKKEIRYLQGKAQEQGLTIVPLKVYTKNRFIKVEVAVARGRHKYDKREVLKKKDLDREVARAKKAF